MKKLIIRFLETDKCLEYLSERLCTGTNNYSDKLFSHLKNCSGTFFTIIPDNAREEYLYELEYGGLIPENLNPVQNPHPVVNPSEKIIDIFIEKILVETPEINFGIKNFIGQPDEKFIIDNFPFVKSIRDDSCHKLDINKDSSFHLLNNYRTDLKKAIHLRRYAMDRWSPVSLFRLSENDQRELNKASFVSDEMEFKITMNIFSIVADAYDDEGYILWFQNGNDFILKEIHVTTNNYNESAG